VGVRVGMIRKVAGSVNARAFFGTNSLGSPKLKPDERLGLFATFENFPVRFHGTGRHDRASRPEELHRPPAPDCESDRM